MFALELGNRKSAIYCNECRKGPYAELKGQADGFLILESNQETSRCLAIHELNNLQHYRESTSKMAIARRDWTIPQNSQSFHSCRPMSSGVSIVLRNHIYQCAKGTKESHSRSIVLVIGMFLVLTSNTTLVRAGQGDLTEEFLGQYEPALKKLKGSYSKVILKAEDTEEGFPHQKNKKIRQITYMANGDLLRLDIAGTTDEPGRRSSQEILVASPRYSFILSKTADKPFVLSKLGMEYDVQCRTMRLRSLVPFATYCLLDLSIPEAIEAGNLQFKVLKLDRKTEANEQIVVMNYSRIVPPNGNIRTPINLLGEYTFLANHFWAIQDHSWGSPRFPTAVRTSIEYDFRDQTPVIKQIKQWRQQENGTKTNINTTNIKEFVVKSVDKEEFTLAHFGLSEPVEKSAIQPYVWAGGLGIVCIAIGTLAARKRFKAS